MKLLVGYLGLPRDVGIPHISTGTRVLCKSDRRCRSPLPLVFFPFLFQWPKVSPRPLVLSFSVPTSLECTSSFDSTLMWVWLTTGHRFTGVACAQVLMYFRWYQRDKASVKLMVSLFPYCRHVIASESSKVLAVWSVLPEAYRHTMSQTPWWDLQTGYSIYRTQSWQLLQAGHGSSQNSVTLTQITFPRRSSSITQIPRSC